MHADLHRLRSRPFGAKFLPLFVRSNLAQFTLNLALPDWSFSLEALVVGIDSSILMPRVRLFALTFNERILEK
jgi:hypothetical protein